MSERLPAKYEDRKKEFNVKDFGGLDTQNDRTAIAANDFAWIENLMPIGHGNLKTVPAASQALATATVPIVNWRYININNTDYQMCAMQDGSITAFNIDTNALVTVAASGTTSGQVAFEQWQNLYALIIAENGYWQWDGTTLTAIPGSVSITGDTSTGSTTILNASSTTWLETGMPISGTDIPAGAYITGIAGTTLTISIASTGTHVADALTMTTAAPASGILIAVYAGRVWIVTGSPSFRTIEFSAPGSYVAFDTVASGGSFIMSDSALQNKITALCVSNDFLYIFGDSSINAISNVRVQSGITVFSNVNITAASGTKYRDSVFPYYRNIMYGTEWGFHGLNGASPNKLSDKLDGIIPLVDFTKKITAGEFMLYDIMTAGFLVYYNDNGTVRPIILCFANGRWFVVSQ